MYKFAFVVLFCLSSILLFLFVSTEDISGPEREAALPDYKTLERITFQNEGHELLLQQGNPRIVPGALKKLYRALQEIVVTDIIATGNFMEYGLEDTEERVLFYFDGYSPQSLTFGNLNEYLGKRYVLYNETQVHAIPEALYTLFHEEGDTFLSKKVFLFRTDQITQVDVSLRGGSHVMVAGGKSSGWTVNGNPADPVFLGGFLKDIDDLSYESSLPAGSLPLQDAGLLQPEVTLEVQWESGNSLKKTTLSVGAEVLHEKKVIGYYALIEKADMIMILPPYALRRLKVREENLRKSE